MSSITFAELNLIPELQRAVADQGYTEPTPIQAQAIPQILKRLDIMGCAQTGTGKTASFTLPLLHLLAPLATSSPSPAKHPVRALVLTPTRELAAQVEESVRTYGKYIPLRTTLLYGGVDIKPQIKSLQGGVEIVVATPGRLLDHLEQKSISLAQVQILILDEADRMLDMGFMPAITRILAALPPMRQNLLFSATFSEEIKKLASGFMRNPTMIEVARRNAPAELVTHQVYEVAPLKKHALLAHLVKTRDMQQVLIFTRMKRDADKLARQLVRDGLSATAIHGDRSQSERTVALDEFKTGKVKLLVATDVAARGIDIDQLPFVINYEIPNTPEDYVHRIGRTGRAGTPGEAISLVSPDEMDYLHAIEKLLKREITRLPLPLLAEDKRSDFRDGGARPARTNGTTGSYSSSREATPLTEEERRERNAQRLIREAKGTGGSGRMRREPSVITETTRATAVEPAYPHFDFSKPYEPSASDTNIEAIVAAKPSLPNKPQTRSIGALLGRKKIDKA
jgi:ATP-dependent RNA helicase RhlE